MSLPTKVKTWLYNVNQILGTTGDWVNDHRQLLLAIKSSLMGFSGGWTHVASSNATTTSTSTDLWSTASDLVWEPDGTSHSWIVLEQTGLGTHGQLLIDLNPIYSGYASNLTLKVSPSVGFDVASPSTTTAPSASDAITVLPSSADWLGGYGYAFTARLHALQSSDGQCTRVVVYVNSVAVLFWTFERAAGAPSGWSPPVMAGASRSSPTVGVMRYDDWWKSAAWLTGRTTGGTMNAYLSCEGFGDQPFGQQILVAADLDGYWPCSPVGVVSNTAGSRGRLGTAFDLWYGSTAVGDGDTYPDDASRQFVQFGHLIFPWNGSSPQTA